MERWCARVQNGARCAPAARGERRTPAQDLTRSFQGREKNFSSCAKRILPRFQGFACPSSHPSLGFPGFFFLSFCPSSLQDILFSHCPVWVILREIFEKILCG